ncbi:MAG: DNA polymerase III subunit delta [Anaerolineae bacterium]
MIRLLHGEDEYSRSQSLAAIKERSEDPSTGGLGTSTLDAENLTPTALTEAIQAAPFLSERRLVIVRGLAGSLQDDRGRPKKLRGHQKALVDALEEQLPHLPETTDIVFVEPVPIAKRNPVRRLVQNAEGLAEEFKPPRGRALHRWIAEQVEELGGRIEPAATETLAGFVGEDPRSLSQELGKLLAYVGEGRPISVADVELLVSQVSQANVFTLVDALGQHDSRTAAGQLRDLLESGHHPLFVLAMITRQFRLLIQVKELQERGLGDAKISSQLRLTRWVSKKLASQARGFSLAELEAVHRKLLETDLSIKTGRSDPEPALEFLVVEIAQVL